MVWTHKLFHVNQLSLVLNFDLSAFITDLALTYLLLSFISVRIELQEKR